MCLLGPFSGVRGARAGGEKRRFPGGAENGGFRGGAARHPAENGGRGNSNNMLKWWGFLGVLTTDLAAEREKSPFFALFGDQKRPFFGPPGPQKTPFFPLFGPLGVPPEKALF